MAGTAIVTAPAKTATDILAAFAGERFCFMAPDALLASGARADWLVVDEAAAIPSPLLLQLVSRFPAYYSPPPFRATKAPDAVFT